MRVVCARACVVHWQLERTAPPSHHPPAQKSDKCLSLAPQRELNKARTLYLLLWLTRKPEEKFFSSNRDRSGSSVRAGAAFRSLRASAISVSSPPDHRCWRRPHKSTRRVRVVERCVPHPGDLVNHSLLLLPLHPQCLCAPCLGQTFFPSPVRPHNVDGDPAHSRLLSRLKDKVELCAGATGREQSDRRRRISGVSLQNGH